MRRATFALAIIALTLAACQSTPPPPAADAKSTTVGDWTVRTGGYVRAETGVVH